MKKDLIVSTIFLSMFFWACAKSLPKLEFCSKGDIMTYEDIRMVKERVKELCVQKGHKKGAKIIKICYNEKDRAARVKYECIKDE